MYKRVYGLKLSPSPPSTVPPRHRLCFYRGPLHLKPAIPSNVDLRSRFLACYEQGSLGSCTANALCGAVAYVDPSLQGSRLFLYYNERKIENTISTDSGAYIYDGIRALKTYGLCSETDWPYDPAKFDIEPTVQCYTNAAENRNFSTASVPVNLDAMRNLLAAEIPITIGFTVFLSFESDAVRMTGLVPMPTPNERILGGHAVLIVGYDDSNGWFIVRNSWGPNWGIDGYFYAPYAYFTNPRFVSDLWTIEGENRQESVQSDKPVLPL